MSTEIAATPAKKRGRITHFTVHDAETGKALFYDARYNLFVPPRAGGFISEYHRQRSFVGRCRLEPPSRTQSRLITLTRAAAWMAPAAKKSLASDLPGVQQSRSSLEIRAHCAGEGRAA